jgi:hypothetical protein
MTGDVGQGSAGSTAPPQYSPDGRWWWTGTEWVPASTGPPVAGFGGPLRRSTNGLAIASLVLGILWMAGLGAVLALIFGLVALKQIKQSGQTQSGHGIALAGTILGGVGTLGAIALWTAVAVDGHSLVQQGQTAIVKVELRQAGNAEDQYRQSKGRYAESIDGLSSYGFAQPPFGTVQVLSATDTSYCLSGVVGNTDYWYYDKVRGLSQTPCS